MDSVPHVQIIRLTEAIDVSDLKEQLETLTSDVKVETERPDIEANVHWFLPPVVEIQLAYILVQPFLKKGLDALIEAAERKGAEKAAETIGSSIVSVFRRSMRFIGRQGYGGRPTAPAPPLRISFEIAHECLSKPINVSLVVPEDLSDEQVRAGVASAQRAKEIAEEQVRRQAESEAILRDLIEAGNKEQAYDIMDSEDYRELRRRHLLYVFRPDEAGWMDLDEVHRRESRRIIEASRTNDED